MTSQLIFTLINPLESAYLTCFFVFGTLSSISNDYRKLAYHFSAFRKKNLSTFAVDLKCPPLTLVGIQGKYPHFAIKNCAFLLSAFKGPVYEI